MKKTTRAKTQRGSSLSAPPKQTHFPSYLCASAPAREVSQTEPFLAQRGRWGRSRAKGRGGTNAGCLRKQEIPAPPSGFPPSLRLRARNPQLGPFSRRGAETQRGDYLSASPKQAFFLLPLRLCASARGILFSLLLLQAVRASSDAELHQGLAEVQQIPQFASS